ncbi:hypothetical protein PENSPDRAFT_667332 [Peniophora sp. CONT]|nr:hypothetical protein PENSPDRAFT_667332 [Peniophora sp. CONT]
MADLPMGRALILIATEHSGNTVLNLTFGRAVAGDRAIRWVLDAAEEANLELRQLPIDLFVGLSYGRPGDTARVPGERVADVIAFDIQALDHIYGGRTASSTSNSSEPALQSMKRSWHILDVRVTDTPRIIPATIVIPYAKQPSRCNTELDNTDMLPLWFWQHSGALGVPITANNLDCLSESPSRIMGTSLKVAFAWLNYGVLEKQVQLRGAKTQSKVAVTEYERGSVGRTDWQDSRYKIGTRPGYIGVQDVLLLGIVFVSPGRVMPLLQLRPEYSLRKDTVDAKDKTIRRRRLASSFIPDEDAASHNVLGVDRSQTSFSLPAADREERLTADAPLWAFSEQCLRLHHMIFAARGTCQRVQRQTQATERPPSPDADALSSRSRWTEKRSREQYACGYGWRDAGKCMGVDLIEVEKRWYARKTTVTQCSKAGSLSASPTPPPRPSHTHTMSRMTLTLCTRKMVQHHQ